MRSYFEQETDICVHYIYRMTFNLLESVKEPPSGCSQSKLGLRSYGHYEMEFKLISHKTTNKDFHKKIILS